MRNILICTLFSASVALGGFERSGAGARAGGLGGATTALGPDAWSVFSNPAGLARLRGPEAGAHLSPSPFGLSELAVAAAAAAIPTPLGIFAVAGSSSGFELYREGTLSLSFARAFPSADIGVTLSHYAVAIEGYGAASALGVDAGCLVAMSGSVSAGVRIRNLNAPAIGRSETELPRSVAMGIAFRPGRGFILTADLQKDPSAAPMLAAGAEYAAVRAFALRLGVGGEPSVLHAGVGVRSGIVSFDYAYSLHGDLGGTHECSLTFRWGGGDEE